jgi:hypothetical protein
MQNLKRSRLVPFLFGWGHWKGGLGDGWSLRGVHPKTFQNRKINSLLHCARNITSTMCKQFAPCTRTHMALATLCMNLISTHLCIYHVPSVLSVCFAGSKRVLQVRPDLQTKARHEMKAANAGVQMGNKSFG